MAKDAVLQVRMDADLKREVEELYGKMGTSFAEAVRLFARQSILQNAMPFAVKAPPRASARNLGMADGEYSIPENIDADNEEVARMFGLLS